MSDDELPEGYVRRLKRNAARCLDCGNVIESKHRHDFVSCSCGNLFVDGGLDYTRFGYKGDFEDLSEYEIVSPERLEQEKLGEEIVWEYYGGKQRHEQDLLATYVYLYERGLI